MWQGKNSRWYFFWYYFKRVINAATRKKKLNKVISLLRWLLIRPSLESGKSISFNLPGAIFARIFFFFFFRFFYIKAVVRVSWAGPFVNLWKILFHRVSYQFFYFFILRSLLRVSTCKENLCYIFQWKKKIKIKIFSCCIMRNFPCLFCDFPFGLYFLVMRGIKTTRTWFYLFFCFISFN